MRSIGNGDLDSETCGIVLVLHPQRIEQGGY